MTVGMVAELKGMNIYTVDQLADLSDVLAQKIMGAHMWRQKARAFLEASSTEAIANKAAKQEATIAELQAQVAALLAAQKAVPSPITVKAKE